jgi:hypothetical protein
MSDGNSTFNRRIIWACFRTCSTCRSHSQPGLYPYARRTVANRAEPSFALLRYSLGGNRPSQTDPHALSPTWLHRVGVRILINQEWCFTLRLHANRGPRFEVSHLRYASLTRTQYELTVKVHRVFPSYCGQAASSPPLQFRRDPLRDSCSVVTRFVQVGTYPTRNFATLGPL